jgi:hypothetical protein
VLSGALLLIAVAILYGIAVVSKRPQGRFAFTCFYR